MVSNIYILIPATETCISHWIIASSDLITCALVTRHSHHRQTNTNRCLVVTMCLWRYPLVTTGPISTCVCVLHDWSRHEVSWSHQRTGSSPSATIDITLTGCRRCPCLCQSFFLNHPTSTNCITHFKSKFTSISYLLSLISFCEIWDIIVITFQFKR